MQTDSSHRAFSNSLFTTQVTYIQSLHWHIHPIDRGDLRVASAQEKRSQTRTMRQIQHWAFK